MKLTKDEQRQEINTNTHTIRDIKDTEGQNTLMD